MSYTIIKHRFALHFPAPEPTPGRTDTDHFVLFTEFSSCNNIHPQTYNGDVRCVDTTMSHGIHEWNGNPMLPIELWKEGHSADGGSIKAYPSRNVTGTGWVNGWQKIARRPIPITLSDGRLAVSMSLSLWLTPERAARYAAGESPFASYDTARRAAWERLILPLLTTGRQWISNIRINISNVADLAAAARLLHFTPSDYTDWNKDSFSIFICLPDWEAEKLERMQREVAEPAIASKPKAAFKFEPGMVIDLHGSRYKLMEKLRSSWIGEKDGLRFRIGPKHWSAATLVQEQAA